MKTTTLARAVVAVMFGLSACGNDTPTPGTGTPTDATGSDVAEVAEVAPVEVAPIDAAPSPECSTPFNCPAATAPCSQATCTAGKCGAGPATGTWCDDGNACTVGESCQQGACKAGVNLCDCQSDADCEAQDDGNPCTGMLICRPDLPRKCVVKPGTVVKCGTASDTACTHSICIPKTGQCAPMPLGANTPCDDGEACTAFDHCEAGQCKGGAPACACQKDADCQALDGDLCDGTLYCDKSGPQPKCKNNPKTKVACSPKDDTVCSKNACDPATGQCALKPVADGTVCDADGKACTLGDHCSSGQCVAGKGECVCGSDLDCAGAEDGNFCNGTLFCDKAKSPPQCALNPVTVVTCSTANDAQCLKNECDPASGKCAMTPVNSTKPCDDGNGCTTGDACQDGACVPGTNTCSCKDDAECAKKDDGNLCNGTAFCNKGKTPAVCETNPATVVSCPTVGNTACQATACNPKSGKCEVTNAPDGTDCDADGNPCTPKDACKTGSCQSDSNICECETTAGCGKYEDGDLCNGTLYCVKQGVGSVCAVNPATKVACPTADDGPCQKTVCQTKTGQCVLQAQNVGQTCDDGNPCTYGEVCALAGAGTVTAAGLCKGAVNVCECQANGDCAAKEDGNLCNGTLYCDKSGPKPKCAVNLATLVACPALDDACKLNTCNPTTGKCALAATNEGQPCSDGSACTTAEACKGGICAGKPVGCDDNDACTVDFCDKLAGCQHGKPPCDDGNDCTKETCDPKTGKCAVAVLDGVPCTGDGDGCTPGDSCKQGVCVVGAPVDCSSSSSNNNVGACEVGWCESQGAQLYACKKAPKADGAACSDGKACKAGGACKAGQCQGADKDLLYVKSVGTGGGATELNAVVPLGDGFVLGGITGTFNTNMAVLLRRVDGAGATMWDYTGHKSTSSASVTTGALVADGAGGVIGVGRFPTGSNSQGAWAARVDGNGKAVWSKQVGATTGSFDGFQAALRTAAGVAVAGYANSAAFGQAWLVHLGLGGQEDWDVAWGQPGWADVALAVTDAPGGGYLAVGYSAAATIGFTGVTALLSRVTADGKVLWTVQHEAEGAHLTYAYGVAPAADGSFVVAGSYRQGLNTKNDSPWLARFDASGKPIWQRKLATLGTWVEVAARADGGFVLAGQNGSSFDAVLQGVDALGNPQWTFTHNGGGTDYLAGLAVMPGSHVVAVGATQAATAKATGLFVRTDAFGHTTCGDAGTCLAKKPTDCDDAQPCTSDSCNAGQCTHPPMPAAPCPNTSACHTAAVCQSTSCTPDPATAKVFTKPVAVKETASVTTLFARADGSPVLLDQRGVNPRAIRLDATGGVAEAFDLGGIGAVPTTDAVLMSSGGYVVAFQGSGGNDTALFDAKLGYSKVAATCGGGIDHLAAVPGQDQVQLTCRSFSGKMSITTWRLDSNSLKPLWYIGGMQTDTNGLESGSAVRADGTGVFFGSFQVYEPTRALTYVQAFQASGDKGGSQQTANSNTADSLRFRDVAVTADGYAAVGGIGWPAPESIWLGRVLPSGTVGTKATIASDGSAFATHVQVAPDGDWVVAGQETVQGNPALFLLRANPVTLAPRWRRSFASAGAVVTALPGHALLPASGGGWWLAGARKAQGVTEPFLVRADPWGYADCAAAGKCAVELATGCDDGKVCTYDGCDPKLGCQSTQFSVFHPCDDGEPCTTETTCKSTGECGGKAIAGCK